MALSAASRLSAVGTLSTGERVSVVYYPRMRRKIPTSFTVESDQLERLERICGRTNLARSSIVRSALEKELRHYETMLGLAPDGVEVIRVEP